ncbi:MAG: ribonuclease E/G [Geminicoccaceae bacterium]|nr:ribonuclease E/G [Geminicoccaceae bacterium]
MSAIRIILERRSGRVEAAIARDDRLVDFRTAPFGDEPAEDVTGRLFLARVTALDRHVDGAFLDIGGDRPGFVLARDARHAAAPTATKGRARSVLEEGRSLLVQGIREAEGDKGPRMTAGPALDGRFLVMRPGRSGIDASPGLRGRARDETLGRAATLLDAGHGWTLRRLAADVDDPLLTEDAGLLLRTWREKQALLDGTRTKPGALAGALEPFEALIWRLLDQPTASIEAADDGLLTRLRRMLALLPEPLRCDLERLDPASGAFEQTGVLEEIERATARELPLAGGGRIIVEHTAACTAIDVDGGGRAALDVDLEAAAEIGLQLRLRNIGGTVIVDFVDLPTRPQRQRLEEALRKAVRGDPMPVQIYPMSPLGIVQLSRTRRGATPLIGSPGSHPGTKSPGRTKPCPACAGRGTVGR